MRHPSTVEKHIADVEKWPRKTGKIHYLRFLQGEKLTRAQAIQAKCYECVQGGDTRPCLVSTCPLISFCQWNSKVSKGIVKSSDTRKSTLPRSKKEGFSC